MTKVDFNLGSKSRNELIFCSNQFFSYLLSILEKDKKFSYFSKEELILYLELLETADKGIKESTKLLKYFNSHNLNEKELDKSDSSLNFSSNDIDFKRKNTFDVKLFNEKNSKEKNEEEKAKEEIEFQEEIESIKTRVRSRTRKINEKYLMENDNNKLELIKRNNEFVNSKCKKIIHNIIQLISADKNTPSKIKENSIVNNRIKRKKLVKKFSFNGKIYNEMYNKGDFISSINTSNDESALFSQSEDISQILPLNKKNKNYFDIFEWDDIEIAKQITFVSHSIFQKIKSKELVNSQWTKVDKKTSSQNVYKLIERFNLLSLWACEEILAYDKVNLRKQVIDKLISIAYTLYKMNNFNDCFSLVTCLNSFFIKSLKDCWKLIDSNTSIPKAKEINDIFSHSRNYAKLREMHDKCLKRPCTPFLGLYLKDLSYMDESQKYLIINNDKDKDKDDYILNFEKIVKVEKILRKFEDLQTMEYDIKPVFKLSFLAEPNPKSEDELNEISKKLGRIIIKLLNKFNIFNILILLLNLIKLFRTKISI
jgi:hypothetical protein